MVRIHSSFNSAEVHNLRGALQSHGIQCEIRGEFRSPLAGKIPMVDAMVELWVLEEQEELARRIITRSASDQSESWTCGQCGESVDGQFGQCWNCQAYRPGKVTRR